MLTITVLGAAPVRGDDAELQELKATVGEMEKTIKELKEKIDHLENERAAQPPPAAAVAAPPPAASRFRGGTLVSPVENDLLRQ